MTCMKGIFSTIICPTAMGKEEVRLSVTWQSTVDSRNICESEEGKSELQIRWSMFEIKVQKIVKIRKNLRQRREKLSSSYHIVLHQISHIVSYNIALSVHLISVHLPIIFHHIISYHATSSLSSYPIISYHIKSIILSYRTQSLHCMTDLDPDCTGHLIGELPVGGEESLPERNSQEKIQQEAWD